jgi:selenocysteine lyase/cysteine desulfurase
MSAVATTEQIRRQFPALGRRHQGHPVAYFDGPGGTQVPARVVDAMSDYLLHHNANTHWVYPTSHDCSAPAPRWPTGSAAGPRRSSSAPT